MAAAETHTKHSHTYIHIYVASSKHTSGTGCSTFGYTHMLIMSRRSPIHMLARAYTHTWTNAQVCYNITHDQKEAKAGTDRNHSLLVRWVGCFSFWLSAVCCWRFCAIHRLYMYIHKCVCICMWPMRMPRSRSVQLWYIRQLYLTMLSVRFSCSI